MRGGTRWIAKWIVAMAFLSLTASTAVADPGVETGQAEMNDGADGERFDRLGLEEPTGLSRAELVTFQTVHGLVLGIQTCTILDCTSERAAIGAMTFGAGAGLGASLLLTQDTGVTPGQSNAVNSGVLWGGWLGFLTMQLADLDHPRSTSTMMLGQLGGLAGGYGLSELFRPIAGDVSLINHSGIWSALLFTLITEGVVEANLSQQMGTTGLLVSSVAGGLGGAALASEYPMSRGRVLVISASGLLGGLVGAATPFMLLGDGLDSRIIATGVTLGSVGGLATAGILTQEWDEDEFRPDTASLGVQPTADGEGMLGTVSGRF